MIKKPLQKIILLDAHAIIHRAYHGMPDFATSKGVPTGAIYGFATMILKIIEDFKPEHIIACYDLPGATFRHEAFAEYKGTRSKTDNALKMQFDATREICDAFAIPIYDAPGFEADDILGTIATQTKDNKNIQIIIASGDMDTLQLIEGDRVVVYTLKRGINDTIVYDEKKVKDRFGFKPLSIIDYKAFRGDPSDNIPGIKGIGEKAATLLISNFGTIEKVYSVLKKGDQDLLGIGLTPRMVNLVKNGKEEAEFSKIIATIRRDVPIEFKIPEYPWTKAVNVEKALEIFDRYELRALPTKLRKALGQIEEVISKKEPETISDKDLQIAAVALCLLDSEKTDASQENILDYAQKDSFSEATKFIFNELSQNNRLQDIYTHIEEPLFEITQKMKTIGVGVDKIFLQDLSKKYHVELDKLAREIHEFAGQDFNIKSPKQLSEILFTTLGLPTKGIKKSKTGSYSTNIDTLEKLQGEYPIIQKIIGYRELEKLLSTYIDSIPNLVGDDGRLHAQFVQNGTVTGRFSSRNPNMQNIPTRSDLGRKIREGFVAEKGYQFISLDYSQVELRVLAILSNDDALIKIFKEGRDIHSAVAALIGGVSEGEVNRDMRRKAKIVNFGILYGMGINALKKEMNSDKEEAQKFYNGFFEKFPKATAFLESTKEFARNHGYTETLFGRRRQFKNINSKLGFIKAMAERMAINAPIQGTAADMIKLAMVSIDCWIEKNNHKNDARLLLQIHDEIVFEVRDSLVIEFNNQAIKIMSHILPESYVKYKSEIPFEVHSSIGRHWGELK
jgi:DNA polymerase-1